MKANWSREFNVSRFIAMLIAIVGLITGDMRPIIGIVFLLLAVNFTLKW